MVYGVQQIINIHVEYERMFSRDITPSATGPNLHSRLEMNKGMGKGKPGNHATQNANLLIAAIK
jgi:hypothetical protein